MDALDLMLAAEDVVVMLARHVPVRLLELSSCGCLLESNGRIEVGTAGLLSATYGDDAYWEDVRVMRCREALSGQYQIGVEFIWTRKPRERSLRRVLARLRGGTLRATWSASVPM